MHNGHTVAKPRRRTLPVAVPSEMTNQHDEPALGDAGIPQTGASRSRVPLSKNIRELLTHEPFAVLCTQGEGQPYGSVVAFAAREDLGTLVFATPTTTRKYRLLSACDRVALVVDSRPRFPDDLTQVEAVTATGRAAQVPRGPEFDALSELLVSRHGYLHAFVLAPTSALFRVDVFRYFHVVRFQEVRQWVPGSLS